MPTRIVKEIHMNYKDLNLFAERSAEEIELIDLRNLAISLKHKLIEFEEEFFEDRKAADKLIKKINRKLRENK